MRVSCLACLAVLALTSAVQAGAIWPMHLSAGPLDVTISETGRIISLRDTLHNSELLTPGQQPALLTLTLAVAPAPGLRRLG